MSEQKKEAGKIAKYADKAFEETSRFMVETFYPNAIEFGKQFIFQMIGDRLGIDVRPKKQKYNHSNRYSTRKLGYNDEPQYGIGRAQVLASGLTSREADEFMRLADDMIRGDGYVILSDLKSEFGLRPKMSDREYKWSSTIGFRKEFAGNGYYNVVSDRV